MLTVTQSHTSIQTKTLIPTIAITLTLTVLQQP